MELKLYNMKKFLIVAGITVVLLFIASCSIISGGVGMYNGMVTKSEETGKAWAQVESVYQRRFDLIPNLVATVKGESAFEKDTLVGISQARASVGQIKATMPQGGPQTQIQLDNFAASQQMLGTALSRLMVVTEKYPDLKANDSFKSLMVQIEGTENRISVERGKYNGVVQIYNVSIKTFPQNVLAGLFHFTEKPYFKVQTAEAAVAPKVQF
jgi:LemA protein